MSGNWMRVTREKTGEWMAVVATVEKWTGSGRVMLPWKASGIDITAVAVFSTLRPTAGGSVWFSPAMLPLAAKLLAELGAEPCERPVRGEVSLLFASDQDAAWGLLGPRL